MQCIRLFFGGPSAQRLPGRACPLQRHLLDSVIIDEDSHLRPMQGLDRPRFGTCSAMGSIPVNGPRRRSIHSRLPLGRRAARTQGSDFDRRNSMRLQPSSGYPIGSFQAHVPQDTAPHSPPPRHQSGGRRHCIVRAAGTRRPAPSTERFHAPR